MSNWITVYEKNDQAVLEDHELADTEETRLYALRMSYHKALNALHASECLGDKNWVSAKSLLTEISEDLKGLICKSDKGVVTARDGFVLDYTQISFLVNKNISRILAKEESYQKALEVGLEACETMFEMEQFDAGLIFRIASMALQNDCTWSSRQLLKFNRWRISELYAKAVTTLESAIIRRENIVCEIAALKEASKIHLAPKVTRAKSASRILDEVASARLINNLFETILDVKVEDIGSCCLDRIISCFEASNEDSASKEINYGASVMALDEENKELPTEKGHASPKSVNVDAGDSSNSAILLEDPMAKGELISECPQSAGSAEALEKLDSSGTNRRSSRKKRVSSIYAFGHAINANVTAGKAAPSSMSWPEMKDHESDEFFVSVSTILNALKALGSSHKKIVPASQLVENLRRDDARSYDQEQAATLKHISSTYVGTTESDYLTESANSIIEIIIASCQRQTTPILLVGIVCTLAQIVERNLNRDPRSATEEMKIDFYKLASSVVKCWSHIVFMHNFSIEESLRLFETNATIFIIECCSSYVRFLDRQESMVQGSSKGYYEVCKHTLDTSLLEWSRQHPQTSHECEVNTLRRCWVFLTYWLTGRKGEQGAHISDMDTKKLLDVIRDISRRDSIVHLPHMRSWNVINEEKISLLEAVLQDNVKVKYLVESHELTKEWLDSAITLLRKDNNIASIFRMGAKRRINLSSCLPLLALETLTSSDNRAVVHEQWWGHFNRIIVEGIGAVFDLIMEAAEDAAEIEEWLQSCLQFMSKHIPVSQEGMFDIAALQTSRSICLVMLLAHDMGAVNLYSSLCDFSTEFLKQVKTEEVMSVFMKSTLVLLSETKPLSAPTTISSSEQNDEKLMSVVLNFALHLLELGAFIRWNFDKEETLGYALFIADLYKSGLKGNSKLRYVYSSIMTTILLGWQGNEISMDQKVDILLDYHSQSCDFNLYALDNGGFLLYITSVLQSCVETSFLKARKDNALDAAVDEKSNIIFDLHIAGASRHSDISTCLGEMYWLLYAFPLVTFSYVDDRSKQCTHFNLSIEDPSTIEKLYIFYLDSVALGLGSRSDRRSSLSLLTQTRTLLELTSKISTYGKFFSAIFVDSMPTSRGNLQRAIVEAPIIDEESRRIMTLMPKTLDSVFYEKLVYAGDSGTGYEVLEIDYICKDFPVTEQRVLHAMELCLRDLTFNPQRYTTWVLLHVKLAEYLEIICDELGELCIPELLSSQVHTILRPSAHISMKDLLDGNLRFFDETIWTMGSVFRKRCGLDINSAVRQAWCGKHVTPQFLIPLVAMKNMLREGMLTVYDIIYRTGSKLLKMRLPMGHAMTDEYNFMSRFQPHVTHGRTMQLLSMDFEESDARWRNYQSASLSSYQNSIRECYANQEKYVSLHTHMYLLCQSLKVNWNLYRDAIKTLDIIKDITRILPFPTTKDPIRVLALNDIIPIILDISYHLIYENFNDKTAVDLWDITSVVVGATVEGDNASGAGTITVIGKQIAMVPCLSVRDKVWATILSCLIVLRDIRNNVSRHDSSSVYTLAHEIKRQSEARAKFDTPWPEWFTVSLADNQIDITSKAALEELHKIFVKRVPQIIAIWSVEKAEHEWDSQLQRIYNYEFLRRKYTRLYLELCVINSKDGSILKTFDLLRESWSKLRENSKSSRRPATLRWIFDQSVRAAAAAALSEPSAHASYLGNLFELLQFVEGKGQISETASRKLRQSIIFIYSATQLRDRGPLTDVDAPLTLALRYCFEKYGRSTDRSLFADAEKKRAISQKHSSRQVVSKVDSRSSPRTALDKAPELAESENYPQPKKTVE